LLECFTDAGAELAGVSRVGVGERFRDASSEHGERERRSTK
jgi:hypothetical protein